MRYCSKSSYTVYCVRDKLELVNESLKQSLLKLKGKNVSIYLCIDDLYIYLFR